MKSIANKNTWGIQSLSFWMTLLVAAAIVFIGVRFMIDPTAGADGFGIPITAANDLAYGKIKGIRDIFSGLVLVPFLFLKMRRAAAIALTAAIIIPATDFLIVLTTNVSGDIQHLLIHGLTVVFMMVISVLLFHKGR